MNVKYGNTPFNRVSKNVKISVANCKNLEKFGDGTTTSDPRSKKPKS